MSLDASLSSLLWPDAGQGRQPAPGCRATDSTLLGLWNFADDLNAVNGMASWKSVTYTSRVISPLGTCIRVNGTGLNRYRLDRIKSPGAKDFTVLIRFRLDATAGYAAIGKWHSGGSPTSNEWYMGSNGGFSTSSVDFAVCVGSAAYTATIPSTTWVVGEEYTLIGRRVGTTLTLVRYNHSTGLLQSSSATNAGLGTINDLGTARNLALGEIAAGGTYSANLTAVAAAYFGRGISDAEIQSLIKNPWQLFDTPLPLSFPVAVAGGGDATASGGTITTSHLITSGAATGAASVSSATVTRTMAVVSGAASGGAQTGTTTLAQSVGLMAGAASAGTVVSGAIVAASSSIIPGAASGAATAGGLTLAQSGALLAGSASVGTTAGGATVVVTASVTDGAASGSATALGATAAQSASIIAGQASSAAQAGGMTLAQSVALMAGAASAGALAPGAVAAESWSLIPCVATGAALVAGGAPAVSWSILAGTAAPGSSLSQTDLDAIAAAVWADPAAVAAHTKLDAILARLQC